MAIQGVTKVAKGSTKRTILLEGPSGVGKTKQYEFLVNGLPEFGESGKPLNVLVASTERKLTTIQHLEPDTYTIEVFDYPDPRVPGEEDTYVKSGAKNLFQLLHRLKTQEHEYDALFLDSLMRWTMRLLWRIGATNTNADARSDYAFFGRKVQAMLDMLASLTDPTIMARPLHVVATWGVEKGEDWEGHQRHTVAIDGRKVGPTVPYFFDDVYMLRAEAETDKDGEAVVSYNAYTRADQRWDAKVSGLVPPGWPARFKGFNLYKVIKLLDGEYEITDKGARPKKVN